MGGDGLLGVTVAIDSVELRARGEVLVRVDPIDDAFVVFRNPGPTSAVVSGLVDPTGLMQGCVASRAAEVTLSTSARHARKVWVRVVTDRRVRVRVRGTRVPLRASELDVRAGGSARTAWSVDESRP